MLYCCRVFGTVAPMQWHLSGDNFTTECSIWFQSHTPIKGTKKSRMHSQKVNGLTFYWSFVRRCLCKTHSCKLHIVKTICNLSVKLLWVNCKKWLILLLLQPIKEGAHISLCDYWNNKILRHSIMHMAWYVTSLSSHACTWNLQFAAKRCTSNSTRQS